MNMRRDDPDSWQNLVILILVVISVIAGLFVGYLV